MFLGFFGEYEHTVDSKGRIILPSKLREGLKEGLVVTRGLDDCLAVYSLSGWEREEKKIQEFPSTKRKSRDYARLFFSGASPGKLDKLGRIFIPEYLRKHAHLTRDVAIIGASTRLEIWDRIRWIKYKKEKEKTFTDTAEELTD